MKISEINSKKINRDSFFLNNKKLTNNIRQLTKDRNLKIKSLEFVKDVDDESMINYSKFISYTKINKAISSLIPVLIFYRFLFLFRIIFIVMFFLYSMYPSFSNFPFTTF